MFDLGAQCKCAIEQTGGIFEDIVAIVLPDAGEQRLKSNVLIILELGIQSIALVKTLHGRLLVVKSLGYVGLSGRTVEEWIVDDWAQK